VQFEQNFAIKCKGRQIFGQIVGHITTPYGQIKQMYSYRKVRHSVSIDTQNMFIIKVEPALDTIF